MLKQITCTAPVNIAVIKYWGKTNETLILPANDSISFTLSQDEMCAKTNIKISPTFEEDQFYLNGKEESVKNPRILNCIAEAKRRAKIIWDDRNEDCSFLSWKIHIASENNFPTAAGLASSAAGYACLTFALGKIYGIDENLSPIARLGSGSACRSMYGGLVQWVKGKLPDGKDSAAIQISSVDQWNDLKVIICVTNDTKKKTSSTEGMRLCMETSELMKHRLEYSVPQRIEKLKFAVNENNWSRFCDITMADSNEMHAVCLSSFPPCVYMNDTSHHLCRFVHSYNSFKTELGQMDEKICYTFDAGPNCCLFIPGKVISEVASLLNHHFPYHVSSNASLEHNYWQGLPVQLSQEDLPLIFNTADSHSIKYFIQTKIGDGPRVCNDTE